MRARDSSELGTRGTPKLGPGRPTSGVLFPALSSSGFNPWPRLPCLYANPRLCSHLQQQHEGTVQLGKGLKRWDPGSWGMQGVKSVLGLALVLADDAVGLTWNGLLQVSQGFLYHRPHQEWGGGGG